MFLHNPFPPTSSLRTTLRFSFFAGLVVFLILYLFKPFNIDGPNHHMVFWHPLVYGLATFIMVVLNSLLLPKIFTSWYKEESWTLGKEILVMCWQIMSIAFVNLVITHFLFGEPMNLSNVLNFMLITASVGIFPVAFILLIKQQLLYKKFATGAAVIEEELHAELEPKLTPAEHPVFLQGDNQNEDLMIQLADMRFISAADNYLKVYYCDRDDKLVSKVIRSTMKKAEAMVQENPGMFRCHRAYIVNLSTVEHVSGNAQGLKLHLQDVDEPIPVSRSLNDQLREQLKNIL